MQALADARAATAVADSMVPRLRRILRVRRETHDTFTVELEARGEPPFTPGQFNMLAVPGAGEVPISISGDALVDGAVLVHTTRAVGAVTGAMRELRAGDVLGVRGPFGTSWPVREAEGSDVVVVAGGIGLAPLRPALLWVLHNRERYGRVVLLYGARTPDDLLFVRELESWRRRLDVEVLVSVDRAAPGRWRGNVGVVTTLVPRAPFDPASTVAMVCGPELMMRFAAQALVDAGVAPEAVWISLERSMKCGVGLCGHCQLGPVLVCRDGPVVRFGDVAPLLTVREL